MYALGAEKSCKRRSRFTKINPKTCKERELDIGIKLTNTCYKASSGPGMAGVGFEKTRVIEKNGTIEFRLEDARYLLR